MASHSLAPTSRSRRTPAAPSLLDPFRLMDSLLSDVVGTRGGDRGGNLLAQPRMNIEDTGDEIRVTAELPGVSENDVEITLDDDTLIIAGEKRDEREVDDRNARLVERVFGSFRRVIQLPFAPDPDQVEARFRDGVLTISIPKNAEQQNRQRQIQVQRDNGQGSSGSRSAIGSSSAGSGGQSATVPGHQERTGEPRGNGNGRRLTQRPERRRCHARFGDASVSGLAWDDQPAS